MKKSSVINTIVTAVSIIVSLSIVALASLQISGKYESAADIFVPLLGLNLLCQAHTQWKSHHKVAYFSIGTATFILLCSVVVFFMK